MAITPRTILRNPILVLGSLAFTAISLLVLVVSTLYTGGLTKSKCGTVRPLQIDAVEMSEFGACRYVASNPDAPETWTENDYIAITACFDGMKDSSSAIRAADNGLRVYPLSESLYNIKGYHQIESRQYEAAIATLRQGLKVLPSTSGTMQNNLAWAGLWVPRKMTLGETRNLYTQALQRDPHSCETVHTGLWVEFAIAAQANGPTRADAINRYDSLRDRYDGCEKRLNDRADENLVAEVLGAGVLDYEMAMLSSTNSKPDWARRHTGNVLVKMAMARAAASQVPGGADLCERATPIGALQHTCMQLTKTKAPASCGHR